MNVLWKTCGNSGRIRCKFGRNPMRQLDCWEDPGELLWESCKNPIRIMREFSGNFVRNSREFCANCNSVRIV